MSVHAGSILHVGANNVIDRIQEAGLGDVRVPQETIREVGNEQIVEKVPGDPDFTFTLNSLDTSTELEAMLTGAWATGQASGQAAGFADIDGTEYKWEDFENLTIASPWKDASTGSAGVVAAGHLVPGYYITRCRYRFGVTDNAVQEIELAGGSYYYGENAPVEERVIGNGATTVFNTADATIPHRIGGAEGTSFRRVFGVMVDGVLQTRGVDYTDTPDTDAVATGVVTFTVAPANNAVIKFAYFTNAAKSWPQTRHASSVVKPGAVRGRHIAVYLTFTPPGGGAAVRAKLGSVQAAELEATVDGEVEREFDNEEIVGRTINGRDCNGSVTVRSKTTEAFFDLLEKVTGVDRAEVIGWLNTHQVELEIVIRNPKDPAQTLKTLYVSDAVFQVPGTPARVNTPTDFVLRWESQSGLFSVFKGDKP